MKSATRRYRSPRRDEQAASTRTRILRACVATLEAGGDLTYGAVAAEVGVQERTVYRHFPTKGDLEQGVWSWIADHLTHFGFDARTEADLLASMRRSFGGFEAGAPLIRAMVRSNQGLAVRLRQQEQRAAMFLACVEEAGPAAPDAVKRQAAAALQVLYSATAWDQLNSFFGMDASEAADAVELAMRSVFTALRAAGGDATEKGGPPGPQFRSGAGTKRRKES
jgi:AcrR family transcriptional regulator